MLWQHEPNHEIRTKVDAWSFKAICQWELLGMSLWKGLWVKGWSQRWKGFPQTSFRGHEVISLTYFQRQHHSKNLNLHLVIQQIKRDSSKLNRAAPALLLQLNSSWLRLLLPWQPYVTMSELRCPSVSAFLNGSLDYVCAVTQWMEGTWQVSSSVGNISISCSFKIMTES